MINCFDIYPGQLKDKVGFAIKTDFSILAGPTLPGQH